MLTNTPEVVIESVGLTVNVGIVGTVRFRLYAVGPVFFR
jgi:hypothetical protein